MHLQSIWVKETLRGRRGNSNPSTKYVIHTRQYNYTLHKCGWTKVSQRITATILSFIRLLENLKIEGAYRNDCLKAML